MQHCMKPVAETEQLVSKELENFQVDFYNTHQALSGLNKNW